VKRIIIRPATAADIEEAFDWYERQSAGLGDEFLDAVQSAIDWVAAHPTMCAILPRETRRALLERFPYGIFYRVYLDAVVIVVCMHARAQSAAVEISQVMHDPPGMFA